ncbi:MAG: cytochrome P450 [Calditrichia bacterium]
MFTNRITNVPYIPRLSAFADSRDMIRNPIEVFERYRARLGHTFTFHFGGAKPAIVSTHPDFIQHVLKKNHQNYHKSDIQVKRMGEFQGQGLLNSHDEYWLRQRRFLQRGFKRDHISALLPIMQQVMAESMRSFDAEVTKGPVDIHQQMVAFTLRLVGKSLFGNSMKDAELEQLGQTIATIQSFIVHQIVQPYKIPWYKLSGQSRRYQRMRIEADNIVRKYIEERRGSSEVGNDLLQVFMDSRYKDDNSQMTDEQILIESLQLLVAGNETSSNALSWTLYLLSRHPEHLKLMREEMKQILHGKLLNFADLHRLTYTAQVLDEAMRLYPPFWMVDRVALQNDEIMGIRIPAGITVIPYIYGTHRNLDFWEQPEVFDPDRFVTENKKARHQFAHIPFGGGPRVCIGSNLAIIQMLLILVHLIQRYDFQPISETPVAIKPMMILRPDGAIKLQFNPRSCK